MRKAKPVTLAEHLSKAGKIGGKSTSPAKQAAARANGRKHVRRFESPQTLVCSICERHETVNEQTWCHCIAPPTKMVFETVWLMGRELEKKLKLKVGRKPKDEKGSE